MFLVSVSDPTPEVASEVNSQLRELGPTLRRIGAATAMKARRGHKYRNRTGATQRSTVSITEVSGGDVFVLLQVGVEHASYLQGTEKRPDDILNVEEPAIAMSAEIVDIIDGLRAG